MALVKFRNKDMFPSIFNDFFDKFYEFYPSGSKHQGKQGRLSG